MTIQYDNFCPDCTAAYITHHELKKCPHCDSELIESRPYVRCIACKRVVYLVDDQDNFCRCGICISFQR